MHGVTFCRGRLAVHVWDCMLSRKDFTPSLRDNLCRDSRARVCSLATLGNEMDREMLIIDQMFLLYADPLSHSVRLSINLA